MTFNQPSADDQQGQPNDPTQQEQEQDFSAHPVWKPVLAMFAEGPQRDALLSQIKESERNSAKAIQDARASAAPEEWRGLIEEAKNLGLTPEELAEGYNSMDTMREQIASDPDGWLDGMRSEIDAAVERGDITRKAGAQLKKDAAAQAAGGDDPADLEDPAVAELRDRVAAQDAWREQQEQREQERLEAEQQAENDRIVQENTQRFMETFEGTFNGDPTLVNVEPKTRYIVANHALILMEGNPGLDEQQATDMAIEQFRERFGLGGGAAPAAPSVPIGGGSNQRVAPQAAAGHADARGVDKTREQAMIEEAMRQVASGIV